MTRCLAQRHPRRLPRTRTSDHRREPGLDLALLEVRESPATCPDQRAWDALAEENALLARELGRVQARCTQWRDDCIAQAARLEALLMRARGELVAKETQLAVALDALAVLRRRDASRQASETASSTAQAAHGPRRVLCVGGRARQIPVYRALVERRGGSFTHVDGVSTDCLPQLQRSLAQADLVIIQPGYACTGVCQAVQSHCARTGIAWVPLSKACVVGFERALAQAADEVGIDRILTIETSRMSSSAR